MSFSNNENNSININYTKLSKLNDLELIGRSDTLNRVNLLCKNMFRKRFIWWGGMHTSIASGDSHTSHVLYPHLNRLKLYVKGAEFYNDSNPAFRFIFGVHIWNVNYQILDGPGAYTFTFKVHQIKNLDIPVHVCNGQTKIQFNENLNGKTLSFVYNLAEADSIRDGYNPYIYYSGYIYGKDLIDLNEETILDVEVLSIEKGDHRDNPLTYLPENFYDQAFGDQYDETVITSQYKAPILGEYIAEGEFPIIVNNMEQTIEEMYNFFEDKDDEILKLNWRYNRLF